MTKDKKGISAKKKTKSQRVGIHPVKVSEAAARVLMDIADELYKRHEDKYRQMGITKPSRRIAVDYVLAEAAKAGVQGITNLNEDNNLWLNIRE